MTAAAPATRFVTLAAARAMECNGCGDCCDSRRTDGYWTWGDLPADQYRALNAGRPLIIPLERVDGGWRDRAPGADDRGALSATRFRCDAFREQPDGGGRCALHGRPRPPKCGEFPAWGADVEQDLAAAGEARLHTGAFPRCTWYGVCVVPDGDPRLAGAGLPGATDAEGAASAYQNPIL